jgi:bleomycin hydrolase
MEDLINVMDNSLENGYGVAWAADVSEKGFSFRDGLAIVPENEDAIQKKGSDNENFSDAGAEKIGNQFMSPGDEKEITQEMRQKAFDNYETTDDHGMHITGVANDQNGTKCYLIKNSWGTGFTEMHDGYFFASEAYVKYKTMDIMVHKDAIPKKLRKKLGIK